MQLLGEDNIKHKFFSKERRKKFPSFPLNGILVIYCSRLKVSYMSHVTVEQRYTIGVMLQQNYKQIDIANAIGKDKSVVSREIKRNCDNRNGEYRSNLAQRKRDSRQKERKRSKKLTDEVAIIIKEKLEEKWSPEQITNRCKQQGIDMVSHESIYQFIKEDKDQGGVLHKNMRRKKKYRNRIKIKESRGKIKDQKSIKERPLVVDEKTRFGDLEIDLIIGENHKGALITMNDRKSGYAKIKLIKSKNAKQVARAIVKELKPLKQYLHTITSDNGKEFAEHKYISEKLGIDYYFAEPYSSWQRGANENFNGLVRQYFPKKTSFEELTWREVKNVERKLNQRPRKRLGFNTPEEEIYLLTKVAFVA
jgi:transposase, IS30 family